MRKQQATAGIVQAERPGPNGNVLYVALVDPAVKDADYNLLPVLYAVFPAEAQALSATYRDALVGRCEQAELQSWSPRSASRRPRSPRRCGLCAPRGPRVSGGALVPPVPSALGLARAKLPLAVVAVALSAVAVLSAGGSPQGPQPAAQAPVAVEVRRRDRSGVRVVKPDATTAFEAGLAAIGDVLAPARNQSGRNRRPAGGCSGRWSHRGG